MPVGVLQAQLDYILVLSVSFFPAEQAELPEPANAKSDKNRPSVWRAFPPSQYFFGISLYGARSGWVYRKPPMIASFDTRADSNGIFHRFQLFLLGSRIYRKMARLAAGHVPGNPDTSAIPVFHNPHT
jgi:hypothetical protein